MSSAYALLGLLEQGPAYVVEGAVLEGVVPAVPPDLAEVI